MTTQELTYTPIFEKDGGRFIFLDNAALFDSIVDAARAGVQVSKLARENLGIGFTGDIQTLYDNIELPHVEAQLGPFRIALIGGEVFDEVKEVLEVVKQKVEDGEVTTIGQAVDACIEAAAKLIGTDNFRVEVENDDDQS